MYYTIVLLMVALHMCDVTSAPMDDPIRIDLPVYNRSQNNLDDSLTTVAPEARNDQLSGADDIANRIDIASNIFTSKLNTASNVKTGAINLGGVFSQPVTTLEGAILETEGIGSQKLSVKENLQNIVAGLFQPKPIVDTITEEEKYGNNGDKFYSAGRAIVSGAENVSNLVNSALEVPSSIFKQIARTATEKLNNLGGRIIGLYNK